MSLADRVLSELLAHAGWIDPANLAKAREEASSSRLPLGQVLVRARLLPSADLVELLRGVEQVVLACPRCRREYPYRALNPRGDGTCPTCSVPLRASNLTQVRLQRAPGSSPSGRFPAGKAPGTPMADTRPDDTGSRGTSAPATPFVAPIGNSTPSSGRYMGTGSRGFQTEGERFGGYELHSELGRGGMGVVYKARRPGFDRYVALKVLLGSETASSTRVKRFQREAELAAKLRHPGIVQVHDFGQAGDHYYLTMDFVEGRALSDVIGDRPLSVTRAAEIGREAADALAHAHEAGVIHRDIKPANIMLTPEGRPVLTDFGLARQAELEGETTQLTRDGALVGTPFFMSPEQATGKREKVVPKSDVWSLGVVIYQMACGALPFDGTSQFELSNKVLHEPPTPPRQHRPDLDDDLVTILLKTLEKDPADRYSARELADELTRYLGGDALIARPRSALESLRRRLKGKRTQAYALGFAVLLCEFGLWGAVHTKLKIDRSTAAASLELRLGELREAATLARQKREDRLRAARDELRKAQALVDRLGQEAEQSAPGEPYQAALKAQLQAIEAALALEPLRSSPRLHLQRGRAYARSLRREEARGSFERAAALDPHGPFGAEAGYRMAALRDNAREPEAAAEILKKSHAALDLDKAGAWPPLLLAAIEVLEDSPDVEKAKRLLERARDLDPRRPEVYLLLSLIARARSNSDGALKAIERCTQLDPKSATAWTEYARLASPSDPRRGEELVDRALLLDPTFGPALELKALLLDADDKPKEALAVLRRGIKSNPDDHSLVFRAALLAVSAEENAQANELLHAHELMRPNSHFAYAARAAVLFRALEHEPALAELRRGAEILADRLPAAAEGEAWLRRAFASYAKRLGRHDLVQNYAESRKRAGDLNGDMLLADDLLRRGKKQEARAAVDKILAKDPLHSESIRLHFELLGRDGELPPILDEVNRLLTLAQHDLEALLVVARATTALLEDPKLTARVTTRLRKLAPKDGRVIIYEAQVFLSAGKTNEGVRTLLHLLQADPTNGECAALLSAFFLRQKDPAQALPYLEAARRFDPFDEALTQNLAALLGRTRPREALSLTSRYLEFYDSVRVTPSPSVTRTHVSLLLKTGQPELGIRFARGLYERYKSYEYLLSEAECLMAIGELKRARVVLDEIRALAPQSPGLKKLDLSMESLGE